MQSLETESALRACASIGYKAVGLMLTPGRLTKPRLLGTTKRRRIRDLLVDLDLSLPALSEHLPLVVNEATHQHNLDYLRAAAELGHSLSPGRPPVVQTTLGGKPSQWEAARSEMAERLYGWAEVAQATRTVFAVKPHVGGALHTPQGTRWLLNQVGSPWIKLVYDYSHFHLRGYKLAGTIQALIKDTAIIHVKDSEGEPDNLRFLLPGDGRINCEEYFTLVRNTSYRGTVMVEISAHIHQRPGYDPLAAATRCYGNLAPALTKSRM
jgi:inosose dehydratase